MFVVLLHATLPSSQTEPEQAERLSFIHTVQISCCWSTLSIAKLHHLLSMMGLDKSILKYFVHVLGLLATTLEAHTMQSKSLQASVHCYIILYGVIVNVLLLMVLVASWTLRKLQLPFAAKKCFFCTMSWLICKEVLCNAFSN